jgi:hypothetical protein
MLLCIINRDKTSGTDKKLIKSVHYTDDVVTRKTER